MKRWQDNIGTCALQGCLNQFLIYPANKSYCANTHMRTAQRLRAAQDRLKRPRSQA